MFKYSIIFLFLSLAIISCRKIETYPDVPEIKYMDYTITDTIDALDNQVKKLQIELSLIDGDGDIGLFFSDTVAPNDTSKVYIYQYNMENGVFIPEDTEQQRFYRIPYVQPQGQNKLLKCQIFVDIYYPVIDNISDTVKYDVFVVDRAMNKSNVITSPEIVIEK